jgi:hypothetical protein
MVRTLIPPLESKQPVRPPMVYIEKQLKWGYKLMIRNLEKESPLDETELNALGEDGWELSGVVQQPPVTYFYFKRLIEK